MAITQMYGFDQMEPGAANLGQSGMNVILANEGYSLLSTVNGGGQVYFATRNGRPWVYSGTVYTALVGDARLYQNLGTWFGPGVKKKAWLGFRYYQATTPGNYYSIATLHSQVLIYPSEVPFGECFIEFEFDWEAQTIRRWVDGIEAAPLTFPYNDDAKNLCIGSYQTGNYQTGGAFMFTDIYAIVQTQDDSPNGRLGAVRVRPLDLDELVVPADWEITQPVYGSIVIGGKTFPRANPNMNVTPYRNHEYTCNRTPYSGLALWHQYSPGSAVSFQPAIINAVNTNVAFTMKFPKPLKLGAYQLRRPNDTNHYVPSGWTVEGSNDGLAWTTLDTKADYSGLVAMGVIVNFEIPLANRAKYQYYRVNFTQSRLSGTSGNEFRVTGLQFFMDPDAAILTPMELLDSDYGNDALLSDQTGGVLRTGILETELEAGIEKPDVGTEKIVKVQLRVSALRDGGSENHLRTKVTQGAIELPTVQSYLEPTIRQGVVIFDSHKAPDGTAWTADSIDALKVRIKSRTGAV